MIGRLQASGWLCIPLGTSVLGVFFIIDGIRTIRQKQSVVVGRDSHFRWKRPIMMRGVEAVKDGRFKIWFGVFLLIIGLLPMLSVWF